MRVFEVAKEFNIPSDQLIQLLREMGEPVRSEAAPVGDAAVAKLRARFERHRRSGATDPVEVAEAVIEDAHAPTRRRRRRRAADEPDVEEVTEAEAEEAAEAGAGEAAEVEAAAEEDRAEPVAAEADTEVTEEAEAPAGAETPGEPETVAEAPAEAEPAAAVEPAEETAGGTDVEPADEAEDADVEEVPVAKSARPTPAGPRRAAPKTKAVAEEAEADEAEAKEAEEAGEPVSAQAESTAPAAAEGEAPPAQEPEKREKPKRRPKRVSEGLPGIAPAASAGPGGKVRIQAEGYTPDGRAKRDKKKKRRQRVDQDAVQENLQRVMAELKGSGGGRKRRRTRHDSDSRQEEEAERERRDKEEATTVRVNEFLTVAELAELVDETATEIIASAFKNLGMMVTINQRLDFDQIELLLDEFGYKALREEEYEGGADEDEEEERPGGPGVPSAGGHRDGSRRPRQDFAPGLHPQDERHRGRVGRHHAAHRRLSRHARRRSLAVVPGHAGPRGVHGHARPGRGCHRRGDPGGRRR
jgi:translation initiation factor IF-2